MNTWITRACAGLAACMLSLGLAQAAAWPERPVSLLVGARRAAPPTSSRAWSPRASARNWAPR